MNLDEAIRHCEEVAISKTKQVENGDWEKGSSTERDCIVCAEEHRQLAEWLKELKAYRSRSEIPNTCEDAISRADARHLIAETNRNGLGYISTKVFKILYDGIDNLPSVTPQPKTGRWKFTVYDANHIGHYECSECHWNVLMNVSDYCPHCGARMGEE